MKTIQQILEEERAKSLINTVGEAKINRTIANKAKAEDPAHGKKTSESQKDSWNDPTSGQYRRNAITQNWFNNREKLLTKRNKKIQTPWGLFQSRKKAIEQAKMLGILNATTKISKGLTQEGSGFFYIDKIKKTISANSIEKMKDTIQKNGSKKWIKIQTPFGIFPTLKAAILEMKRQKVPNPKYNLKKFLADPNSGYKKLKDS